MLGLWGKGVFTRWTNWWPLDGHLCSVDGILLLTYVKWFFVSHGEPIKVKCSYGVPKFKPSCQKKFHICSCFVIVFPLLWKNSSSWVWIMVCCNCFSCNFFISLYRKETAMKSILYKEYTTAKILSFNMLMTELNFPWLNISIQGRRHVKNLGGDNPT